MVGAINPVRSIHMVNRLYIPLITTQAKNETWETQYHAAMQQPFQLAPGEAPPVEGSESESSSSSSSGSPSSPHLSGGAIAGIVVGVVVFVAILVLLFFVLGRNRVYRQWMSSQDGRTERTARWALGGTSVGTPSWGPNRKSDVDPRIAHMDDHPSTATPMYSPETMQVGIQSPYVHPASPPPQHFSGQSGWGWGQPQQQMQQQQEQPSIRVQQEPFELDSGSHR